MLKKGKRNCIPWAVIATSDSEEIWGWDLFSEEDVPDYTTATTRATRAIVGRVF